MEPTEGLVRVTTVLDTREQFCDNNEIDDQRGCKERIFTHSVHRNCVSTAHHEFGVILIHRDLGVTDSRDVFDDNAMIDFATRCVIEEDFVGGNDVVYHGRFADLLGAELAGRRQIPSIIIACILGRKGIVIPR